MKLLTHLKLRALAGFAALALALPAAATFIGIDGTTPAGLGAIGPGHHARVRAGQVWLDGQLEIFFPHSFMAAPAQTYEIITVTNPQSPVSGLHGRFRNVREGDPVARVGNVALFLTYAGGDGNDVVLRAWPVERLENPRLVTGGQFAFDLPTQPGRTHYIESADDLRGSWDIVLSVPGDGATHALLLPAISTAGGRVHRSR
ncbi:MAG: hypothetical protein ACK45B_12220 [Limisphaerales bacterium]